MVASPSSTTAAVHNGSSTQVTPPTLSPQTKSWQNDPWPHTHPTLAYLLVREA